LAQEERTTVGVFALMEVFLPLAIQQQFLVAVLTLEQLADLQVRLILLVGITRQVELQVLAELAELAIQLVTVVTALFHLQQIQRTAMLEPWAELELNPALRELLLIMVMVVVEEFGLQQLLLQPAVVSSAVLEMAAVDLFTPSTLVLRLATTVLQTLALVVVPVWLAKMSVEIIHLLDQLDQRLAVEMDQQVWSLFALLHQPHIQRRSLTVI
jgi:hypothetical protein